MEFTALGNVLSDRNELVFIEVGLQASVLIPILITELDNLWFCVVISPRFKEVLSQIS